MSTTLYAQRVSGRTLDADDNQPLAFVELYWSGTNIGVISDTNGYL